MVFNTVFNSISVTSWWPVHLPMLSWSSFNPLLHKYSFWRINNQQLLETLWEKEKFLLFPQCFLLIQIILSPFVYIYDIISLFATEFEEPKIGIWGKGLTSTPHNILSKLLAAFPHNNCKNNGQRWERNEPCHNDYHQSWERILAEPGIELATSCSQVRNSTDWAMELGSVGWKSRKMLVTSIFSSSKNILRGFLS